MRAPPDPRLGLFGKLPVELRRQIWGNTVTTIGEITLMAYHDDLNKLQLELAGRKHDPKTIRYRSKNRTPNDRPQRAINIPLLENRVIWMRYQNLCAACPALRDEITSVLTETNSFRVIYRPALAFDLAVNYIPEPIAFAADILAGLRNLTICYEVVAMPGSPVRHGFIRRDPPVFLALPDGTFPRIPPTLITSLRRYKAIHHHIHLTKKGAWEVNWDGGKFGVEEVVKSLERKVRPGVFPQALPVIVNHAMARHGEGDLMVKALEKAFRWFERFRLKDYV